MKNCLICGISGIEGVEQQLQVVRTFCHFNEVLNANVYKWTYGYTEKSWLTEEEAVYQAEALIYSEKAVKDIHVKQQEEDGSWTTIDLKTSPYAHHNKIAPTIE